MGIEVRKAWIQTQTLSKSTLIPPFNKYIICICYSPDMVLDAGDIAINKTDKIVREL